MPGTTRELTSETDFPRETNPDGNEVVAAVRPSGEPVGIPVAALVQDGGVSAAHIASQGNPHNVTASQIGLGNVDDTSDEDKPLSVATLNALDQQLREVYKTLHPTEARSRATSEKIGSIETSLEVLAYRIERLHSLGLTSQQKDQAMTDYAIVATSGATPVEALPACSPTRLQLVNQSPSISVYVKFGSAPTSVTDSDLLKLDPGDALDTSIIPATPVWLVSSTSAEVRGGFSVPEGDPNPVWEDDFETLRARLGVTDLLWVNACRELYSDLRRMNVLGPEGSALGLYVFPAQDIDAALNNWAAETVAVQMNGPITHNTTQGFDFDGLSQHLVLPEQMGDEVTTTSASAFVWADATDQATGRAAMGDGIFVLEPNRSSNQAAIKGFTPTSTDLVDIPALGSMLGVSRTQSDQFTAHTPGGDGRIVSRTYVSGYPIRPVVIGASNSSVGVQDYYQGVIRAAYFGKNLNSVQVNEIEVAMARFFESVEMI